VLSDRCRSFHFCRMRLKQKKCRTTGNFDRAVMFKGA
jgi:hypothetical protein